MMSNRLHQHRVARVVRAMGGLTVAPFAGNSARPAHPVPWRREDSNQAPNSGGWVFTSSMSPVPPAAISEDAMRGKPNISAIWAVLIVAVALLWACAAVLIVL